MIPLTVFFCKRYGNHRDLHKLTHSFPTRRSSDLLGGLPGFTYTLMNSTVLFSMRLPRSEEHTSELQSRELISYAVSCLKKNKSLSLFSTSPAAQHQARKFRLLHPR